jgi:single-strand DNA-binding protein
MGEVYRARDTTQRRDYKRQPVQKTPADRISGQSPEMKYIAGGTAITTFTIASTERWKNSGGEPQEHTEWFNIKVFGKRAEIIAEHLHKRSRIFLEGGNGPSPGTISNPAARST